MMESWTSRSEANSILFNVAEAFFPHFKYEKPANHACGFPLLMIFYSHDNKLQNYISLDSLEPCQRNYIFYPFKNS